MIRRLTILAAAICLMVLPASAATFTPVTAGSDYLQDQSSSNSPSWQVFNAYAERYQFHYGTSRPPRNVPAPGTNMQALSVQGATGTNAVDMYGAIQLYVVTQSVYVATNFIGTSYTNGVNTWALTWEKIKLLSGMSTNGWRKATVWNPSIHDWRIVDDAMWTNTTGNGYGYIEAGDIIGPWIIDDLQRGLAQLHTRRFTQVTSVTYRFRSGKSNTRSSAVSAYESSSSTYSAPSLSDAGMYRDNEAAFGLRWDNVRRWITDLTYGSLPADLPFTWRMVLAGRAHTDYGGVWWNPEPLPIIQDHWTLWSSGSSVATNTVNVGSIGSDLANAPLDIAPALDYTSPIVSEGFYLANPELLISPAFTHDRYPD